MAPQNRFKHRRRMRTAVRATPHPSERKSYAYSHEFRQFNLFAVQAGRENDPLMEQARQLRLVPSKRTNRRHARRLHHSNHLRPYVRQGNRRASIKSAAPESETRN
jgi:hypothetical protein